MISNLRRGALIASGVLCLAIGGAAIAQPAPPPPPADARRADQPAWRDPAQRQAEQADRLADVLQLRPDQRGSLHAFLDAAAAPGGARWAAEREDRQDPDLTTPQRLDRMLAHFDERRARLVARAEATKIFYAQLTPSQQRAFDSLGAGWARHRGFGMGDGGAHGAEGRGPEGPGGGQ
jgi:hypothetical protein